MATAVSTQLSALTGANTIEQMMGDVNSLKTLSALATDAAGSGDFVPTTGGTFTGDIFLSAATTETRRLELGASRTGNGTSHIDLIGDATYGDYGARFIRNNGGPNTSTDIAHRGTGALRLLAEDAAPITFETSGVEKIRINNSGNITIGNFSSASGGRYLDIMNTNSGATDFSILRLITQEVGSSTSTSADLYKRKNGQLTLSNNDTDSAAYLTLQVGASERMRIDSDGNVGIGTSSPSSPLHVAEIGTALYIATFQADLGTNNGRSLRLKTPNTDSATDPFVWQTGNSIGWQIDSSEVMRINSDGNVGIGTSSPSELLEVAGKIKTTSGGVEFPDGTTQTSAASAGITTGKAIAMAIVFG